MKDKILNWFANGRVGSSSKAMAMAIAGIEGNEKSHPHDPDDFNRCLLFLDAVPEARNHLDKVAELSSYWKALIERFDEIEQIFLAEVGLNWSKGDRASKTYDLMKSIIQPIEDSDPKVIRFGEMGIKFT
ncbi:MULTISPECIES: hypothetical protein [unclassified Endozoicomonas]|uniref:hypothetical protein n=1 Tax=unclassified Endozoicomonas TaxID=2644528 RepID=UPI003BB58C3D